MTNSRDDNQVCTSQELATKTITVSRASRIARGLGLGGLGAWVISLPLTVGAIRRYRGAQLQFPWPATRESDVGGR